MRIGIHLTPFWSPSDRSPTQILDEAMYPVEVAENVATLDHLCHGRLVLSVAVGYREQELASVGLTRKDRGPKLDESLEIMKQLWSGEEVTYRGRYTCIERGRLGFTPYQKPHPPIETLNAVGFTIYSLPRTVDARIEYLQKIAAEIVSPVKAQAVRHAA